DPRRSARRRPRRRGALALRRAGRALFQGRRGAPEPGRRAARRHRARARRREHHACAPAAALAFARRRLPGQDRPLAGGRGRGGRGGRGGADRGVTETLEQVGLVARRSVRRTLRQPALIIPTIVFPLLLLAINSSGLSSATRIPGFPASSYLDFSITV